MTALGIGGAAANPFLAAFPVVGTVAKGMADRGTLKKVDELSNLIRSGGVKPSTSRALSPTQLSALQTLLVGQITGQRQSVPMDWNSQGSRQSPAVPWDFSP
jgi:hypothetical protein